MLKQNIIYAANEENAREEAGVSDKSRVGKNRDFVESGREGIPQTSETQQAVCGAGQKNRDAVQRADVETTKAQILQELRHAAQAGRHVRAADSKRHNNYKMHEMQ